MAKETKRESRAAQTAECVAKAAEALRDAASHRRWTLAEFNSWKKVGK